MSSQPNSGCDSSTVMASEGGRQKLYGPTFWITELRLCELKTLAPGLRASNVRAGTLTQVFKPWPLLPEGQRPTGPDAKGPCPLPGALQPPLPSVYEDITSWFCPSCVPAQPVPPPCPITCGLRQTALPEDGPAQGQGPSLPRATAHPISCISQSPADVERGCLQKSCRDP